MSGSQLPPGGRAEPEQQPAADPSMEDILASIRRILSEDEPRPATAEDEAAPQEKPSDVLLLDSSMMVAEPPEPAAEPGADPEPEDHAEAPIPASKGAGSDDALVAPEVLEAAATAVNSLVRRLAAERGTLVRSGGPSIEDLVREELRPMLKAWLDTHLPPLVERLVRAEIERVVGRVVP